MKIFDALIATLSGIIRIVLFLTLITGFVPVALTVKLVDRRHPYKISQLFHLVLLRILGIRLRLTGTLSPAVPVLFVANHTSYLDIPVLGALLPASFIAKSEVARWPLFGFLSKLQNTIFIERRSAKAAAQRAQLQDHLAQRQSLILFPEGTSSDGMTVLPFKSSLFSIVEDSPPDNPITIQPISVTCIALNGKPLSRAQRDQFAWYGDMTLEPHLWNAFKRGRFTVDVIFHPPLMALDYPNRKILALACQTSVAQGIERSLAKISFRNN